MRVQDTVTAFPIICSVNGKQYIAMSSGSPSIDARGLGGIDRELQANSPPPTAVLWAFALP